MMCLLIKLVKLGWSITESAFQALKSHLVSAPILALPDFSKRFTVEIDASDKGLGTVLQQDGHPITFMSKACIEATVSEIVHLRKGVSLSDRSSGPVASLFAAWCTLKNNVCRHHGNKRTSQNCWVSDTVSNIERDLTILPPMHSREKHQKRHCSQSLLVNRLGFRMYCPTTIPTPKHRSYSNNSPSERTQRKDSVYTRDCYVFMIVSG